MLRIFTILRHAFERPPEREGRELFRVYDPLFPPSSIPPPDSEPTPPPSEETGGEPGHGPDAVTGATRRDAEHALRQPEKQEPLPAKAKALRKMMDEALRLIDHRGFAKALDGIQKSARKNPENPENADRMDIADRVAEVAAYCYHARDIVSHLGNEADTIEQFQNGDLPPGDFVRWMSTIHEENPEMDAMRQALEIELAHLPDDIDALWLTYTLEEKKDTIDTLCQAAHAEERLAAIREELKEYAAYLDSILKTVQEMRDGFEKDNQEYWDEVKQIFSPKSFAKEGWENAMAILAIPRAFKKIWEATKKKWEENKDHRAAELALTLGKPIMDQQSYDRLGDEVEKHLNDNKDTYKKRLELARFDSLFPGCSIHDEHDPALSMAKLEVAAERGWLYGMEDESEGSGEGRQTIFGTPLRELVPKHWPPIKVTEFYRKLRRLNLKGEQDKKTEGAGEGSKVAGTPKALIDIERIIKDEKDYWKAVGLMEWAFQKKVDIGEIGGSIFALFLHCIATDPMFAKIVHRCPKLLSGTGDMAGGLPSAILYSLKIKRVALRDYAKKAAQGQPSQALLQCGAIPGVYELIRQEIMANGGMDPTTIFDQGELDAMGKKNITDIPESIILSRTIGKVMECHEVTTRNGHVITIWDSRYDGYRREMTKGDPGMTWEVKTDAEPESYGRRNSLRLLKPEMQKQVFILDTNGHLRHGARPANVIKDIVRNYIELRDHHTANHISSAALQNFVTTIQNVYCQKGVGPLYTVLESKQLLNVDQLPFRDLIRIGIITKDMVDRCAKNSPGAQELQGEMTNGTLKIGQPLEAQS